MLPVQYYCTRSADVLVFVATATSSRLGACSELLDHEVNRHHQAGVKLSATLCECVHRHVARPETSALAYSRPTL